jgi:hypothetical protein
MDEEKNLLLSDCVLLGFTVTALIIFVVMLIRVTLP